MLAFERLREWPDFGTWLNKTAKYLEDYPTPNIPDKLTLVKKLSQCLNPKLPHGTHKTTLEVYQTVFKNVQKSTDDKKCNDMAIFSIGL